MHRKWNTGVRRRKNPSWCSESLSMEKAPLADGANGRGWEWGWMLQSNQKNLVPLIRWCFVTDSSVPPHACLTVCLRNYLVHGKYANNNHQWRHPCPGFTGEPATFDHQVRTNNTSQEATGIGPFCLYLNILVMDVWRLLTDLYILYNRQHETF